MTRRPRISKPPSSWDPKFIPAYKGLTAYAAAHNDVATRRRVLLKTVELNPRDIAASYDYVMTFYHDDRAKFDELAEQYIAKNPDAAPTAALLTAMADAQPGDAQRHGVSRKDFEDVCTARESFAEHRRTDARAV